MTPQQEQLQEDMRGALRGELLIDEVARGLYSTDASIFAVEPMAIVTPRDEADVQTVVRYAAERRLPITARGAGTGLAGEALNTGIILDFSRHFRGILQIDSDTVRVQPGVVYRQLNERLAEAGRRLAPDPASGASCTIGGMLATNASGPRVLRHGYMRDHVVELRCVLDTAEAVTLGLEPKHQAGDTTRKGQLVAALTSLLHTHAELIAACQPRTRFNRCGYLLHDVLTPAGIDLARLLVGSEGTLALFTEATLRTVPLPADCAVVLLGFPSVEAALQALPRCLSAGPAACELLERRVLTLTGGVHPEYNRLIQQGTQAVLLVDFEAERAGAASRAAHGLLRRLSTEVELTAGGVATAPGEITQFWQLRDLALPLLYRLPGRARPIPFLEDIGVPVEQLADFHRRVQELLQRHQLTASFLVHAGAGQVHVRPFLDVQQPGSVTKLQTVAGELYSLVLDCGGTISSQHGVGLARTPWVAQQYGRLYQVLRDIKTLFDPQNLLNPGKIVDLGSGAATGQASLPWDKHLRKSSATEVAPTIWLLRWSPGEVEAECGRCNGCGACRTETTAQRMCPLFRVTHAEQAAPRAKANLLRTILATQNGRNQVGSDEVREVADLCINCRMCARECPAHVNIPRLMLEAKAQNTAENGLRWDDWVLARTEAFAAFGSAFALLINPILESHPSRWVMERLLGVSRRRRLPPFARRSFLSIAARRGWTKLPRRPSVAYFVDVFANYNAPHIAEATVAVLHHHGIEVYVPPNQIGCGMAPLAVGDVEAARQAARRNLRVLADLARSGCTIVCSEPTAALMLRQDYGSLLDDPDVELVAARTKELTTFLWDLHSQGKLRTDFRPLPASVGHHVPCHLKALGQGEPGPQLLALIPQLRPLKIDVGCSGMAGTFGLKATNFDASLQAGKPMLDRLRQRDLQLGVSECSPCRLQMEQGTRKRSLHPIEILAMAYGLLPDTLRKWDSTRG